ncbi:hypothetical protein GCM10020229_03540 [Kitasatospora albolonga]
MLLDDRIETLRQGDFLAVRPAPGTPSPPPPAPPPDVLVPLTPGMDRFDYYRLLTGSTGRGQLQEIRESGEHYDNHYVESEVWQARTGR